MSRILLCLLLATAGTMSVSGPARAQETAAYQAGVHYFPIEPAQPVSTDAGVEVIEVFSYACVVCAQFEPTVAAWKQRKPETARFDYLPVAWNPAWEAAARAFYAARALGVLERTHDALLKAMHVERKQLDTLEALADWYAAQGVDRDQFLAAARSFAVNAKIARSRQLVPRYGIEGTPAVIVAGKYRITGSSAGGYDRVFDVVDFLVAREGAGTASP